MYIATGFPMRFEETIFQSLKGTEATNEEEMQNRAFGGKQIKQSLIPK